MRTTWKETPEQLPLLPGGPQIKVMIYAFAFLRWGWATLHQRVTKTNYLGSSKRRSRSKTGKLFNCFVGTCCIFRLSYLGQLLKRDFPKGTCRPFLSTSSTILFLSCILLLLLLMFIYYKLMWIDLLVLGIGKREMKGGNWKLPSTEKGVLHGVKMPVVLLGFGPSPRTCVDHAHAMP